MAKYNDSEVRINASPEEIFYLLNKLKPHDYLGEIVPALADYLPYETVKPLLKEGIASEEWEPKTDQDLRQEIQHYKIWWKQKIKDERGISCHRGRAKTVIRLFLAGIPEWGNIGTGLLPGDPEGGYYQRGSYNEVAALFGWEEI